LDKYDEYVQQLAEEVSYVDAAAKLGVSQYTFAKWLKDLKLKGLRPNAFREHWSITREDFATLLRKKNVPLERLS
jgi:hypothetical protein